MLITGVFLVSELFLVKPWLSVPSVWACRSGWLGTLLLEEV